MTHDGRNLSGVDRHPGVHDRDWDQELNEYPIARDLVLPLAAARNSDVPRKSRTLRSPAPKGRTPTHVV